MTEDKEQQLIGQMMKERTAVKKQLALNKKLLQSYVEAARNLAKHNVDQNHLIYSLDVENEELIGYYKHLRSEGVNHINWPSKGDIIEVVTDIKQLERQLEKLNAELQNAGIQFD